MKSLDIETAPPPPPPRAFKTRNPYGPSGNSGGDGAAHYSPTNTARTYFMFCLALFVIYGLGKLMIPTESDDPWANKGGAAGGWGTHPIIENSKNSGWNTPVTHYHDQQQNDDMISSTSYYNTNANNNANTAAANIEIRESDLLMILSPLVYIPTHSRPEYTNYQGPQNGDVSEEVLYDKNTPHGMAFDFLLNRDTRPYSDDDNQMVQRFVLTLLFYATGGKDDNEDMDGLSDKKKSSGGWESSMAHFLTGLHECHWVKKSLEDAFWSIWGSEGSDADRRVGVTKCNANMEVTEIRLADLNIVGFIPEEIKWLTSLESLDLQNNHLAGPIPKSIGELDELRYLSLDGNNFSGTIPDVFDDLSHLERAYLNFNDFNGSMPPSLCTLREEGVLEDLWSDCGGYPITCTCCTVCCDMVSECNAMDSQKGG